ncbi:MAG: methylmalonyl-CoA epimerase [Deferribacteraceae bacterium]|jgi:methylmalonyl-CoA/ethylmalonyl-CoA epimerase|nr:methylmalonyl-CoA epimerase [Deferribacteraceae bacterium]
MLKKIDHIGIAVSNLDSALAFYQAMGVTPSHTETVESQKVKTAFITVGDVHIELLEPTEPDSSVAKFLEKHGEGMHHIAYEVDDVQKALESLKTDGLKLIDETPKLGAHNMTVAFVHPKSVSGVLTEICAPAR